MLCLLLSLLTGPHVGSKSPDDKHASKGPCFNAQRCFHHLTANIEKWGPTTALFAETFRASRVQADVSGPLRFHSFGFAEHHALGSQHRSMNKNMTTLGFRTFASPARPTLRSAHGTSGGTSISVRQNLAITPFHPTLVNITFEPLATSGAQLCSGSTGRRCSSSNSTSPEASR